MYAEQLTSRSGMHQNARPNIGTQTGDAPLDQTYVVPILVKALAILDTLRTSPSGMRLDDLSRTTGVARSTTYRIVRTLVLSEHLVHCRNGLYRTRRA